MTRSGDGEDLVRRNAAILQRAWSDDAFRERLRREPRAVLAEHGVPLPDAEIVVLEDGAGLVHLVLPAKAEEAADALPERSEPLARLVDRAASDTDLRQRLLAAPRATLESEGVELPPGVEIRAVENDARRVHLLIPERPDEGEVSDHELLEASGGSMVSGIVLASAGGVLAASAVSGLVASYAVTIYVHVDKKLKK